jgi:threonine dehydrogenase-like Zn-dependent dehydrogenase
MSSVNKTFLLGALASCALGAVIALFLHAVDASGEIGGIAFVLGAGTAGLIGGAVARRMPPPRRRH